MNEHLPASMNSKQNWEERNIMILTPILEEHGGLLDLQDRAWFLEVFDP